MSGGAFEFSATDQSSNVFNPGDIISRATSGAINFGITGKQIGWIVGITAVAAVAYAFATHRRKG